jgi:hypothetical protein
MRASRTWALLAAAACSGSLARAQLELLTDSGPQCVFSGVATKISATFRNAGETDFKCEMRTRMLQASSATVAPLDQRPWKQLRVLARQTVLESAPLDFPPVKAETKYLVQWLDNTNRIMGTTEVLAYPTNLLHELKLLVDESWNNLGVLDPRNQIKPALKHQAIGFVDLAQSDLDAFSGKLAVVGSCGPDDTEWSGLTDRIRALAQKGTPVVWIQGPLSRRDKIQPSFYVVPQNRAAVVVVQPGLIADLPGNPRSQLNLLRFCQLALHPEMPALPTQPR